MSVSFLITSHKRKRYFQATFDSIKENLKKDDELVIVEDSQDDWGSYLETLGVNYQFYRTNNQKYRSGVFAKNIALKRAKNEFICINDTEVIHKTPFYKEMIALIQSDPNLFIVPDTLWSQKYYNCPDDLCSVITNQMAPFVAMTTKKNLMDIGGWDERFVYWGNDDNDLMHRLELNGVHHKTIPGVMLHQFHPRPPSFAMGDYNHEFLYEENKNPVANVGKEWGVL